LWIGRGDARSGTSRLTGIIVHVFVLPNCISDPSKVVVSVQLARYSTIGVGEADIKEESRLSRTCSVPIIGKLPSRKTRVGSVGGHDEVRSPLDVCRLLGEGEGQEGEQQPH
jgi:hypothetical protein